MWGSVSAKQKAYGRELFCKTTFYYSTLFSTQKKNLHHPKFFFVFLRCDHTMRAPITQTPSSGLYSVHITHAKSIKHTHTHTLWGHILCKNRPYLIISIQKRTPSSGLYSVLSPRCIVAHSKSIKHTHTPPQASYLISNNASTYCCLRSNSVRSACLRAPQAARCEELHHLPQGCRPHQDTHRR